MHSSSATLFPAPNNIERGGPDPDKKNEIRPADYRELSIPPLHSNKPTDPTANPERGIDRSTQTEMSLQGKAEQRADLRSVVQAVIGQVAHVGVAAAASATGAALAWSVHPMFGTLVIALTGVSVGLAAANVKKALTSDPAKLAPPLLLLERVEFNRVSGIIQKLAQELGTKEIIPARSEQPFKLCTVFEPAGGLPATFFFSPEATVRLSDSELRALYYGPISSLREEGGHGRTYLNFIVSRSYQDGALWGSAIAVFNAIPHSGFFATVGATAVGLGAGFLAVKGVTLLVNMSLAATKRAVGLQQDQKVIESVDPEAYFRALRKAEEIQNLLNSDAGPILKTLAPLLRPSLPAETRIQRLKKYLAQRT